MKYWKQSLSQPVQFSHLESPYPVAVVNGKMIKMTPLREFMERLESGRNSRRLHFRTSNNEADADQYQNLKKRLENEIIEKR